VMSDSGNRELVARTVVGTAIAATAVSISPTAAGFVGLAGALAGPTGTRYLDIALQQTQERIWAVWAVLTRKSGLTPEEVLDRVEENPDLVPLIERIHAAAAGTNSEAKLRAFGAMLSDVVSKTDPNIGEALILAQVIGNLEKPHALVLSTLYNPNSLVSSSGYWRRDEIVHSTRVSELLIDNCLGSLVRDGLAQTHTADVAAGGTRYEVTQLGRQIFAYMQSLGERET
jgi:DNA-binding HxlR family transcriptional regulator